MSGTISFTSATAGTMHITISGAGVNIDVPFTYTVRGNQVAMTLDTSVDPYVSNLANPLIATVSLENNQFTFTMSGHPVVATPVAE
jgi:predicted Zn-dependent protease